jgi:hypothetical protein
MRLTVGEVHMQYTSVISVHGVLRGSDTIATLRRRRDCRKGRMVTQACFWLRGMRSVRVTWLASLRRPHRGGRYHIPERQVLAGGEWAPLRFQPWIHLVHMAGENSPSRGGEPKRGQGVMRSAYPVRNVYNSW